jgi:hypothetical protein
VFRTSRTTNKVHFLKHNQQTDTCNSEVWCFLCCSDWILTYYSEELRLQRVKTSFASSVLQALINDNSEGFISWGTATLLHSPFGKSPFLELIPWYFTQYKYYAWPFSLPETYQHALYNKIEQNNRMHCGRTLTSWWNWSSCNNFDEDTCMLLSTTHLRLRSFEECSLLCEVRGLARRETTALLISIHWHSEIKRSAVSVQPNSSLSVCAINQYALLFTVWHHKYWTHYKDK